MTGIESIAAERQRQIEQEGWTAEHDDDHDLGEIGIAAACYAVNACAPPNRREWIMGSGEVPPHWPWQRKWWKPKTRREDLVRAGALIAAEIDRLDRADQKRPEVA